MWINLALIATAATLMASAPSAAGDDLSPARSKKATKAKTIKKVTARLNNSRFTRFTTTGMSSFDQRLHLCADKRFIYDTVSSIEGGIVDPDVRRVEGTWKVVSASISGQTTTARVRGIANDGGALTVTIRARGSRVTVDGNPVIAERSDLCGLR